MPQWLEYFDYCGIYASEKRMPRQQVDAQMRLSTNASPFHPL